MPSAHLSCSGASAVRDSLSNAIPARTENLRCLLHTHTSAQRFTPKVLVLYSYWTTAPPIKNWTNGIELKAAKEGGACVILTLTVTFPLP